MASWDDGKNRSVKKVQISYSDSAINSIKVDYDSSGNPFSAPQHGGTGTQSAEFSLSFPEEYLTEVTGYYSNTISGEVITGLTFKTNRRTLGPYGTKTRTYFSTSLPKDSHVIGFHGKSGTVLNALEVHYGPIDSGGDSPGEIYGGNGGLDWDDWDEFADPYLGVKEFVIGYDESVIVSITVTYDQAVGDPVTRQRRGGAGGTVVPITFEFPNEYLKSVSGHYAGWSIAHPEVVIKSLTLVTNKKQYGPYGEQNGVPFELSAPNKTIIAFRGRSGAVLNAIGAYYGPIPKPIPAAVAFATSPDGDSAGEIYGGNGGLDWDDWDGFADPYLGVKEFVIGYDESVIVSITVTYAQAVGDPVKRQRRGGDGGTVVPITFDSPNEYLKSVSGHYSNWTFTNPEVVIKSLTLVTNKKKYGPYGVETGQPFELSAPNKSIIAFRGRSGAVLDAIGAYYGPIPANT